MSQQSQCSPEQSFDAARKNRKVVRLVVQHIMHSMSEACQHADSSKQELDAITSVKCFKTQDKLRDAIHC